MSDVPPRVEWPTKPGTDDALIARLVDSIQARLHGANRRAVLLLAHAYRGELSAQQTDDVRDALTGFRYDPFEPHDDAMRIWTQAHQCLNLVCQSLAGQLFPDATFAGGRSGATMQNLANRHLDVWLADRFRFGFSEWLSPRYYTDVIASLTLLIDHTDHRELADRAALIVDLALLDIALHSFRGGLTATMGRACEVDICDPNQSRLAPIWASAFGDEVREPDFSRISAVFVTRQRYEVPHAIREIAREMPVRHVYTSQGIDADEVKGALAAHPKHPRTSARDHVEFWWGQNAVCCPETITSTVRVLKKTGCSPQGVSPLVRRLLKLPAFVLRPLVTLLNPVITGRALQRANIQTLATPEYLLSSVQHYQPGAFGDQQHLWHATLGENVHVFAHHPAVFSSECGEENVSRSEWVGNGINPDIRQHHNILLAIHLFDGRAGMYEGTRRHQVRIHFPFVHFDQTRLGANWVAGQHEQGYIGIIGTEHFQQLDDTTILMRGARSGYLVMCAGPEEYTSFSRFLAELNAITIELVDQTLNVTRSGVKSSLAYKGDFVVAGKTIDYRYPRLESHAVHARRLPSVISVRGTRHTVTLDWPRGTRDTSVIAG